MQTNWRLFKVYLLAGTFTFSGGMAMLPVIERELCQKSHLISQADLYEYSTLAQTFPGVIALTNACLVGKKINGTSGMLVAGLGAILPAFVLMSAATALYQQLPQTGVILSILTGVRAASAGLLFSAAFTLARYNLRDRWSLLLAFICLALTLFNLLSAPSLIILAALVGLLMGRRQYKERA